jgi:hypothetical protein
MRKYYPDLFILIMILLLSSCATILNRRSTNMRVYTNIPATIVFPSIRSNGEISKGDFNVARSKKPLIIKVYNDSISKTFSIKSINSFAYWLNLCEPPYSLIGFLIDRKNAKRFTYPVNIYLDLTRRDSAYFRMIPVPPKYQKHKFIVSLTPEKIISPVNPVIEVAGERKLNSSLSAAAMFGYLLPGNHLSRNSGDLTPNIKGISAGLQAKWFIHHSGPQGFYTALGFNYLNNRYRISADLTHVTYTNSLPTFLDYTDSFYVHKQTYTINLLIGYPRIYKRLSLDVYGGFGLRFKNVQNWAENILVIILVRQKTSSLSMLLI